MDLFTFGLIAVTVLLMLIYHWYLRSLKQYPPSPSTPLPIVGHLFALSSDQRSQFKKWHQQCGDIFSLHMGPKMMVILNGYDLIKETLMKRGEDFSDRPFNVGDFVSEMPGLGVVCSSGHVWKEQRSVSLHILRDFGLGRNILAERIQEEVSHYLRLLASYNGKPTDIKIMTSTSTANIMSSILFGHRFEYTDVSFQKLITYMNELLVEFSTSGVVNFIPMLRHLPGNLFGLKQMEKKIDKLYELFQVFIDQTCVGGNSSANFISQYKEEQKKRAENGETTMNDKNLKKIIFDLFFAGTETTSTTVYFFVLYMLNHPNVQNKIFDEINEHFGTDQSPTIQDRSKLTYLNAAILETQRLASLVPLAFPHTCPRDVTVRGYTIPKGSFIMPNLDSALYDEKIWGHDAMSFRPERFLHQDGPIKNYDELVPFSVGRRACLGESMAKTELFLYLANMIQKFEFLPVDPDHPPPMKYIVGVTVSPVPYEVRIVSRAH
ncbi:Cytochrome P450 2C3 [Bulinus truncatus]|nr:Cytochrome P450 2C3 [Bulinus truncatus]